MMAVMLVTVVVTVVAIVPVVVMLLVVMVAVVMVPVVMLVAWLVMVIALFLTVVVEVMLVLVVVKGVMVGVTEVMQGDKLYFCLVSIFFPNQIVLRRAESFMQKNATKKLDKRGFINSICISYIISDNLRPKTINFQT